MFKAFRWANVCLIFDPLGTLTKQSWMERVNGDLEFWAREEDTFENCNNNEEGIFERKSPFVSLARRSAFYEHSSRNSSGVKLKGGPFIKAEKL